MEVKRCGCGCGAEVVSRYVSGELRGQLRNFIHGHGSRLRSNEWSRKPDSTNSRTGRWRARRAFAAEKCALESPGVCKGRIEVHHKDKNTSNNADSNLIAVCRTHHFFLESGRITIDNPSIPEFYVDASGKRRYRKD